MALLAAGARGTAERRRGRRAQLRRALGGAGLVPPGARDPRLRARRAHRARSPRRRAPTAGPERHGVARRRAGRDLRRRRARSCAPGRGAGRPGGRPRRTGPAGPPARRATRRAAARAPLRRALDLADACGAGPLADRARHELLAAGARPRRPRLSGVDALTASERRIAAMAADGRSNPEIAQALFVPTKTVEAHLSKAYRKLDIRSRTQLPRALESLK